LYRKNTVTIDGDSVRAGSAAGRGPRPGEEFSEEKVNNLKTSVLEALKNAANIRDLKADESITVSVFGGVTTVGPRPHVSIRRGGGGSSAVMEEEREAPEPPARGTILTIRVKKSDVDAFAKGKLTLDEFRKRAGMAIYTGEVGNTGGGVGGFFGSTEPNFEPESQR
jgi:hypothetical protein